MNLSQMVKDCQPIKERGLEPEASKSKNHFLHNFIRILYTFQQLNTQWVRVNDS